MIVATKERLTANEKRLIRELRGIRREIDNINRLRRRRDRIIIQLRDLGWTERAIANLAGVKGPRVNQIYNRG